MFQNYKFGDISKGIYNKFTKKDDEKQETKETEDTNKKAATNLEETTEYKYKFGDVTRSVYNKWSNSDYKFGDLTKSSFYSITGQYQPFNVDFSNKKLTKVGFLQKQSYLLLTYRKYWVVLRDEFLYLFNEKKYDQCVELIDISKYNQIRLINSPNISGYIFEVFSEQNECQRFISPSMKDRNEWVQLIMKTINIQKLDKINKSLNINQNQTALNLECIAYYIIDLEYNHSDNGSPEVLLHNQNFMISTIIWSYIHEPNKEFDMNLIESLNEKERATLKYWRETKAVGHGIGGGLKQAALGPVQGFGGGVMAGFMMYDKGPKWLGLYEGPKIGNVEIPPAIVVPLSCIAGTLVGTFYFAPKGLVEGFKYSYDKHSNK